MERSLSQANDTANHAASPDLGDEQVDYIVIKPLSKYALHRTPLR
jgi:hypothetical protein